MDNLTCDVPPKGWYCTRGKGHDGPCAAHPVPMTSHADLKRLAENFQKIYPGLDMQINPAQVLALLAEIEQLKKDNERLDNDRYQISRAAREREESDNG